VLQFIEDLEYPDKIVLGFFTQVDARKRIHKETLAAHLTPKGRFLKPTIPYSSEIEKMGIYRAPVNARHPKSRSAQAYHSLWEALHSQALTQ